MIQDRNQPASYTYGRADGLDAYGNFLILALIVSVTFLLKFIVPIGGGNFVFVAFLIVCALTAFGATFGYLETHKTRLLMYLVTIGILFTTQLLGGTAWSLMSIVMICIIHLPYVFVLREGGYTPGIEIKYFRNILSIIACLGILQFFLQYIIGTDAAFFIDTMLPEQFVLHAYNAMNSLPSDSEHYKSTGFFMQEPSNFSQLLALAIIIEILYFQSTKRFALYFFAFALTFSGTGLIILGILLPAYLLMKKKFFILILLILTVFSAPIWAPLVGLQDTVDRVAEFQNVDASGFARFISPAITIDRYILAGDWKTMLMGIGAGNSDVLSKEILDYEYFAPTWGKIILEYGLIGGLMYFSFFFYALYSSKKNGYVIAALAIMLILLGEYLFPPTVHALILALLLWPRHKPQEHVAVREDSHA